MLKAGDQCNTTTFAPAVGCCPVGFQCVSAGVKNATCQPGPPSYTLSPNCPDDRRAALEGDCRVDKCCPDGFDCVQGSGANTSSCQWTGRPIVPPPTYKLNPMQLPPGLQASWNATTPAAMPGDAPATVPAATEPDMMSPRQACSTGYLCPASTLPSGCSRRGNRWRAPSCKCYDTPLPAMMNGKPPGALAINRAGQFIDRRNGNLQSIQGINWFGFNNGQTMLDGLWAGYRNASLGDFPTVLKRIKLLGFTGIRLPFTFQDLDRAPSTNLYVPNCAVDSISQFRNSLTPTYTGVSSTPSKNLAGMYVNTNSCPFDTNPTEMARGTLSMSNKHLPGPQDRDTWNRFLWVIQYTVGQGFYVTIDFHFEQAGLQNDPARFAAEWRRLWTDIVTLPTYNDYLDGRVIPELANEWDLFGCRWDTATGGCTAPYASSMQAASAVIRDISVRSRSRAVPPILVEGTGQLNYGFNWGDGFITDLDVIRANGLSNPRGCFAADTDATRYKTVLAPHVYGPSVTGQSASAATGVTLWDRLHRSWGSKSPAAVLDSVITRQYPVAITEFGSDCDIYGGLGTAVCQSGDAQHLRDLASYMLNTPGVIPTRFSHDRNRVWFWWSWNANSGDTGGIVTGSGAAPWYVVKWYKIRYLEQLGLCPWYRTAGSCARL